MRTTAEFVSILIPTCGGGELTARVVASALGQRTGRDVEVVVVDSGSPAAELEALEDLGARVERIEPADFDHGLTRDLAAARARGGVLVFLNQDALPADEDWLEALARPFDRSDPPAAVQGAIREFPHQHLAISGRRRFYWDSCGPRFYFTRESKGWLARHGGVGFSTVNCAISRSAWRELPFGRAPILEDKKWQKEAARRGWRIETADRAVVWHTHDYDLRGLARRCLSEGYGWRQVAERYSLASALRDLCRVAVWRDWLAGVRAGRIESDAELLYPVLRPLTLWWGNRWAREVRL